MSAHMLLRLRRKPGDVPLDKGTFIHAFEAALPSSDGVAFEKAIYLDQPVYFYSSFCESTYHNITVSLS